MISLLYFIHLKLLFMLIKKQQNYTRLYTKWKHKPTTNDEQLVHSVALSSAQQSLLAVYLYIFFITKYFLFIKKKKKQKGSEHFQLQKYLYEFCYFAYLTQADMQSQPIVYNKFIIFKCCNKWTCSIYSLIKSLHCFDRIFNHLHLQTV